jgi:hypothetical protein
MIRLMSELPPDVLGFEAHGKVTAQDYQTVMMPEINRVVASGERLRVVYHLGPEFEGFTVGAMVDDAIAGLGHVRAWKRAAVVSDLDWVHKSFGFFSAIMPLEIRLFPNSELSSAVDWAAGKEGG